MRMKTLLLMSALLLGGSLAAQAQVTAPIITSGGGFTATAQLVPTVAASAHATGTVLGGLLTLANAGRVPRSSGLVQAVSITFAGGTSGAVDVVFFNALPTTSTITDGTALAVAAADLGKVAGVAHVTDITALGTPQLEQAGTLALPFTLAIPATTLYAAVVARATITPSSTTDMTVSLRLLQD